eukprot:TRINITY_DN170_c0_g1_i1.p1 TRINITY_DN170_c0_g1~~TRINITY_DN170_c0_g1_i1.p1  ORF type:complete len:699 (+),score=167.53 TRINITY_DN170_c0_g1_i1:31-2127(+)
MSSLDHLCTNTIRCFCADVIRKANSGHPGAPMGMAPTAHLLWRKFLKFAPTAPRWPNRDRFILSNGHACSLLYTMLHLNGYNLSINDLKSFRQLNSKTPGHPEFGVTEGVEVTTGPLGQGFANAVGIALAERHMAARFNKPSFPLFDHYTYVFCGDGCLMEGVTSEAASLAGHLGLNKLIVIYDDNKISIDGGTNLAFSEDVPKRFRAYGWNTITVKNGDSDFSEIASAIAYARQSKDKPTLISLKTIIGFGSKKQGTEEVHGSPLKAEDIIQLKKKFGFNPSQSFAIPKEVYAAYADAKPRGEKMVAAWTQMLEAYAEQFPKLAAEVKRRFNGELPSEWLKSLPKFTFKDKADATRNLSHKVLNCLAAVMPEIVGGSADLTPSNKTSLKNTTDMQKGNYGGRYIRFGVREHAMAAIGNGLASYGAFIPFTATFLNFIEYAYGAVRLSALSGHQQLFIMTHDSIAVGEDGPTHQPIEALTLCRATPNILTLRPADGNETVGAYVAAINNKTGPSVLALTRQNLPQMANSSVEGVQKGGYVVDDEKEGNLDLIMVASGSEVDVALKAANLFRTKSNLKVRVVSMPCMELFDRQSVNYRREVITPGVLTVSIEALSTVGWEKYAHLNIGMQTFGCSAPDKVAMAHFGFTPEKVCTRITKWMADSMKQSQQLKVAFPSLLHTHFPSSKVNVKHTIRLPAKL